MNENRSSVRCPACGMVNWATADGCKRCGEWFNVEGYARPEEVPPQAQQQQYDQSYAQQPYGQEYHGQQQHAGQQQYYEQPYGQSYGQQSYAQPQWPGAAGAQRSVGPGRIVVRSVLVGILIMLAVGGLVATGGLTSLLRRAPEWREFSSADGDYTVKLPSKPAIKTKRNPSPVGELEFKFAESALGGEEGCAVMYADYPFTVEDISDEDLKEVSRAMASETQSSVLSMNQIRLDGHRGMEVEMQPPARMLPNGRAYARFYLYGSRLYVIVLTGRKDGQLVRERHEFFDSFSVGATAAEDE